VKKTIFFISCAATAAVLAVFFSYVSKIAAYDGFMSARSKISSAAGLACAFEVNLQALSANESTAIIKIPSINSDGMIVPDFFDYCAVTMSNRILMFSLIPSPSTARKHKTLYYKNFPSCTFNTSGNMLEFTYSIHGVNFQHYSSVIPDFLPIPEKGTDIFQ
jgi:hypothetical protein